MKKDPNVHFKIMGGIVAFSLAVALIAGGGGDEQAPQDAQQPIIVETTNQTDAPTVGAINHDSRYVIAVFEASWGMNCADMILRERQYITEQRNSDPAAVAGEDVPVLPRQNNVLRPVSNLCNGQPTCEFTADNEKLGSAPLRNCIREMVILYRCFQFDRQRRLVAREGDQVFINCKDAGSGVFKE